MIYSLNIESMHNFKIIHRETDKCAQCQSNHIVFLLFHVHGSMHNKSTCISRISNISTATTKKLFHFGKIVYKYFHCGNWNFYASTNRCSNIWYLHWYLISHFDAFNWCVKPQKSKCTQYFMQKHMQKHVWCMHTMIVCWWIFRPRWASNSALATERQAEKGVEREKCISTTLQSVLNAFKW